MIFNGVLEMERPGGNADLLGYANYGNGYIEIRPGMRPVLRECVINHEKRHFAGYTHKERRGFAIDCGDGTHVFP